MYRIDHNKQGSIFYIVKICNQLAKTTLSTNENNSKTRSTATLNEVQGYNESARGGLTSATPRSKLLHRSEKLRRSD